MAKLSFLVTYRGNKELLEDYIDSVRKYYPNSEIVISEQYNDFIFLQGQLFNLAYTHSNGDLVILMDADIRFRNCINFEKWMLLLKHPYIGYNKIFDCTKEGKILRVRPGSDRTHGGCSVFTRSQFESSCGYSNLMCDWGAEDDILDFRVNGFKRINSAVNHIYHPKRKSMDTYCGNRELYETHGLRDKRLDGYKQTIGNLIDKTIVDNRIHLKFDRIGVVPKFIYKHMLRDFESYAWKNTLQNNCANV